MMIEKIEDGMRLDSLLQYLAERDIKFTVEVKDQELTINSDVGSFQVYQPTVGNFHIKT